MSLLERMYAMRRGGSLEGAELRLRLAAIERRAFLRYQRETGADPGAWPAAEYAHMFVCNVLSRYAQLAALRAREQYNEGHAAGYLLAVNEWHYLR